MSDHANCAEVKKEEAETRRECGGNSKGEEL